MHFIRLLAIYQDNFNPGRGVKENLKPCVYKHRKFINERSGTFCRMVRADHGAVEADVAGLISGNDLDFSAGKILLSG